MWISEEIDTCSKHLRKVLTQQQWQQVEEWCKAAASKVAKESKTRQINKFNSLYLWKHGLGVNPDKVVHNASDRRHTEDEKQVLALGLNFAVTPKDIPTRDITDGRETSCECQQDPSDVAASRMQSTRVTTESCEDSENG